MPKIYVKCVKMYKIKITIYLKAASNVTYFVFHFHVSFP